jgi:hypothetical protein
LTWLPGNIAKEFTQKAAEVLTRYFDGDMSLVDEIKNNRCIGPEVACVMFISSAAASAKRKRESNEMPKSDWIYGTESEAFPGLIKIGRSGDVKVRLSSGNTFCAPEPHTLIAAAPTFDPKRDEEAAHEHFGEFRVEGEFFRISEAALRLYFTEVLLPIYHRELDEAINRF